MHTFTMAYLFNAYRGKNAILMMMGSAEELPSAPAQRTKFIEDMTEAEAASAVSIV